MPGSLFTFGASREGETGRSFLFGETGEFEEKLWVLFDWGSERLENGLITPGSFLIRSLGDMIVQRLEQLMEDGPRLTNGIPSANSIKHKARETYPILWEKMRGLQNRQSLTQRKISKIIDKDLVPKTIGTWKKTTTATRKQKKQNI